MTFRKDINGLRAIAVIAVVLFHFNPTWLPGGFAGVDVFFVISGFLMTGIIFRGIESNDFSIFKFYIARANRIIPALAALCFALLIFGWFYLTPLDYKVLGKHIAGSIGFISNFLYLRESSYFDAASLEKWLLHTWSLSVEWQFYIIYPLILVALGKIISNKVLKPIVLVGATLSFVLCIIATYRWPTESYYLLPTRAWEMMIGGVAYLYPLSLQKKQKKNLELIGLSFIVGSYLLVSAETPWPGYMALFPVLGSFLIIQAERSESVITGNIAFQKLGSWSYSIYLWHWPLIVAIYYFNLGSNFIYIGVALSATLGFLSHRYIESIKFKKISNLKKALVSKTLYLALLIGLTSSYIFLSNGFESRFNLPTRLENINTQLTTPLRDNGYCFYSFNHGSRIVDKEEGTNCYLGEKVRTKSLTLLFGDSFAGHNEPFFDEVFKKEHSSFQSISTEWCAPSLNKQFTGPTTHLAYQQCLLNREYLKNNMHNYRNIIFAGSWGNVLAENQIEDTVSLIKKSAEKNINTFIMAAPYEFSKNPLQNFFKYIYFEKPFNIKEINGNDRTTQQANEYLKEKFKNYPNVHFIDRNLLYDETHTFQEDGVTVPYSLDGSHLSILGSKHSAKHFMKHPDYNKIINYFILN